MLQMMPDNQELQVDHTSLTFLYLLWTTASLLIHWCKLECKYEVLFIVTAYPHSNFALHDAV